MALPNHTSQTAIVMGNGPSLASVPRSFLDAYPTFGCNYIGRLPYSPTYFVCIDSDVLGHHAADIFPTINAAQMAFISNAEYVKDTPDLALIRSLPNVAQVGRQTFVFDGEIYMSGNTAVYVALKIAYFMGFARVFLVGVDHTETFEHFTPDYPKGTPQLSGMRYHFNLANIIYNDAGREIINLSPRSPLDKIFRRGELTDVL